MAGPDPAIHLLAKKMDPRVKPAGDETNGKYAARQVGHILNAPIERVEPRSS
jgi:hypothetical protein